MILARRRRAYAALTAVVILLASCSTANPSTAPSGSASAASPATGSPLPTSAGPSGGTTEPGASVSPTESQAPDGSGTPGPTSTPSGTGAPLPECAYKDKAAKGDPDRDWATMVLDTIYKLPADFAPRKVVDTSRAGLQRGYEVIPAVVDDLQAMHEASIKDGAEIAVRWAYRSYAEQQGAFAYWVRQSGEEEALTKSARPGHSEHQLGTAIDFRSADSLKPPWEYEDWATTKPGAWMGENAWRFGFVLSYPKGMDTESCYGYESWHYRYVDRDLAQQIHDSGLVPRRFLWELAHPG